MSAHLWPKTCYFECEPPMDTAERASVTEGGGESSRFVAMFVVAAGLGLGAYFFPYELVGLHSEGAFQTYLSAYARGTGHVLHLFDPTVSVSDSTISGRFSIRIVRSCDAMEANILFVAAMLSLPAPRVRKALGLTVGLAALVALNVLRLCSLYYVGIFAPARFDFAHYELWPLAMVAFATVDLLVCARWMTGSLPLRASGPDRATNASA